MSEYKHYPPYIESLLQFKLVDSKNVIVTAILQRNPRLQFSCAM